MPDTSRSSRTSSGDGGLVDSRRHPIGRAGVIPEEGDHIAARPRALRPTHNSRVPVFARAVAAASAQSTGTDIRFRNSARIGTVRSGGMLATTRSMADLATNLRQAVDRELGCGFHINRVRRAPAASRRRSSAVSAASLNSGGAWLDSHANARAGRRANDHQVLSFRRNAADGGHRRPGIVLELRDQEYAAIVHAHPGFSGMIVRRSMWVPGSITYASAVARPPSSPIS